VRDHPRADPRAEGVFTLASDGTLGVLNERAITPAAAAILELGTAEALADTLVRARSEARPGK
jgi:hypothetical protein